MVLEAPRRTTYDAKHKRSEQVSTGKSSRYQVAHPPYVPSFVSGSSTLRVLPKRERESTHIVHWDLTIHPIPMILRRFPVHASPRSIALIYLSLEDNFSFSLPKKLLRLFFLSVVTGLSTLLLPGVDLAGVAGTSLAGVTGAVLPDAMPLVTVGTVWCWV